MKNHHYQRVNLHFPMVFLLSQVTTNKPPIFIQFSSNGWPRRQVTWAPLGAGLGLGVGTAAVSAREPRKFEEVIAESGLEDWSVTWKVKCFKRWDMNLDLMGFNGI